MDRQLMDILERACRETGSPSAAGIVVSHDSILALGAFGLRRHGADTPVTVDDQYHTGSNAKAMTATMIASLIHKGKLQWDSRPHEVFSDLVEKVLPDYKSITLELLLRHHAGIPPYTDDEAKDFVLPDWGGVSDEQQILYFSRWLLQHRDPVNEPGTEFLYSNAGYCIAAAMVEAVTGRNWKDLLNLNLFDPLGIDAIAGCGWPGHHGADQPWGHLVEHGEVVPHDPDGDYQLEPFLAPAGDVCIAMLDYGRFLQMNLKGLQGSDEFLPSRLIRLLHNDGIPGYGMGWGVTKIRSLEELGLFSTHAGSAGTFIMVAGISHELDRAVAFATNSGVDETIELGFRQMVARLVKEQKTAFGR
jgi:CubicO group peptidase (beta-lactamase class C family)